MEESKSPPGEPERIVCSCPEGRLGFALTRNSPGGEDVAHPDRVVIQGVTLENAITSRLRLGDVLVSVNDEPVDRVAREEWDGFVERLVAAPRPLRLEFARYARAAAADATAALAPTTAPTPHASAAQPPWYAAARSDMIRSTSARPDDRSVTKETTRSVVSMITPRGTKTISSQPSLARPAML